MAVANRTITFPSLVAGVQTIPWVATVTLAPVSCRGVKVSPTTNWEFVGTLVGWTLATHPRWRLKAVRWKQRIREYISGEFHADNTDQWFVHSPVTFPDPNPANWDDYWTEYKWFSGQATCLNAASYLMPWYEICTISDIEFEFEYYLFPPNPLRDPDTNLIIRDANGIIMRGP